MGVKVGNSIVRAGMSRAAGGQPLVTGDGFVERLELVIMTLAV